MKSLYALAISTAVLTSWSAVAETTVTTTSTSCRGSAYGPSTCTETRNTSSGSQPANEKQMGVVEERLYREQREARIRKWEEFCKPTGSVDDMGITRLRYAHAGCDLGRSGPVAQMQ